MVNKYICLQGRRCGFEPWVRKVPWRRKWQPASIFLAGKFHGQRGLGGYSPWDLNTSDVTERLWTTTHNIPLLKVNALAAQQELLQFLLHIWNYYLEQWGASLPFPSHPLVMNSCLLQSTPPRVKGLTFVGGGEGPFILVLEGLMFASKTPSQEFP